MHIGNCTQKERVKELFEIEFNSVVKEWYYAIYNQSLTNTMQNVIK